MTSPDSPHRPESNAPAIWLVVGVVVVLLGVVAVLATRGSGDSDKEVPNQIGEVVVGTTMSPGDQGPGSTVGEAVPGATTVPGESQPGATTVPAESESESELEPEPGSTPLPKFEDPANDLAVGETIPTITGTDLQGQPMTIGAGDGKAKVILFVAHWCPHCQREVPAIVEHLADTPMPADVELLAVSTAVDPTAPNYPPVKWLESEGWEAPTMADTADQVVASYFGISGFPFFVVADADGKVVFRTSGELSMDQFDGLVEAARTGTAPR